MDKQLSNILINNRGTRAECQKKIIFFQDKNLNIPIFAARSEKSGRDSPLAQLVRASDC